MHVGRELEGDRGSRERASGRARRRAGAIRTEQLTVSTASLLDAPLMNGCNLKQSRAGEPRRPGRHHTSTTRLIWTGTGSGSLPGSMPEVVLPRSRPAGGALLSFVRLYLCRFIALYLTLYSRLPILVSYPHYARYNCVIKAPISGGQKKRALVCD